MEKDITIRGWNMHYTESGPESGHPAILMHGWGCNRTTVASIAAILSQGMHVYTLDLPGHGQSDEPAPSWGVYEYAEFIEDFCKRKGIANPVLVGHSYGGRIAIVMASEMDIPKMMLVDSAGIKPKRKPSYYIKVYSFKAAKRVLPLLFGKERGKRAVDKWRNRAGSADYNQSSAVMKEVMARSVNQDLKHLMPKIKASTLLVWGEDDTATPLSDARYMERHIPDAGLVAFPGCGHYSFLDNPAGFAAVTREFFKNELKPH